MAGPYTHTFYVNQDLNQNEIRNAVLENLGAPPSSPSGGQVYFDTVLNTPRVWSATSGAWYPMSSAVASVSFGNVIGGTNNNNTFIAGSGASITFTGGGTVNANLFSGSAVIPVSAGGTSRTGWVTNSPLIGTPSGITQFPYFIINDNTVYGSYQLSIGTSGQGLSTLCLGIGATGLAIMNLPVTPGFNANIGVEDNHLDYDGRTLYITNNDGVKLPVALSGDNLLNTFAGTISIARGGTNSTIFPANAILVTSSNALSVTGYAAISVSGGILVSNGSSWVITSGLTSGTGSVSLPSNLVYTDTAQDISGVKRFKASGLQIASGGSYAQLATAATADRFQIFPDTAGMIIVNSGNDTSFNKALFTTIKSGVVTSRDIYFNSDVSGVAVTSSTSGDTVIYDGQVWRNKPLSTTYVSGLAQFIEDTVSVFLIDGTGISTTYDGSMLQIDFVGRFNDCSDVNCLSATSGQTIVYNGTTWVPGTAVAGSGGGVTDHGALTGLSDDDHTQYIITQPTTPTRNLITMAGTSDPGLTIAGLNDDALYKMFGVNDSLIDVFSVYSNQTGDSYAYSFASRVDSGGLLLLGGGNGYIRHTFAGTGQIAMVWPSSVATTGTQALFYNGTSQYAWKEAVLATNPALTDARAPTAHTHGFADVTGIRTERLLGRTSAGSGSAELIALGTGLYMAGGFLHVSGITGAAGSGGVSDHGLLTGLGDDDHSQYIFNAPASATRNVITMQTAASIGLQVYGVASDDFYKLIDINDGNSQSAFAVYSNQLADSIVDCQVLGSRSFRLGVPTGVHLAMNFGGPSSYTLAWPTGAATTGTQALCYSSASQYQWKEVALASDIALTNARAPTAHTHFYTDVTGIAPNRLLGRTTAGSGAAELIAVGSGLYLAGGVLHTSGTSFFGPQTASFGLIGPTGGSAVTAPTFRALYLNDIASGPNTTYNTLTPNARFNGVITFAGSNTFQTVTTTFDGGGIEIKTGAAVTVFDGSTFDFQESTLSPFTVTSNVVVTNLNANFLQGREATTFADATHLHNYVQVSGLATNKLLGRSSTGSGVAEIITLGTGLYMAAGTLHVSGITGGAGAPTDATYLTLTNNGSLSAERALAFNAEFSNTDAGANSTYTVELATSGIRLSKLEGLRQYRLLGNTAVGSGTIAEIALGTGLYMANGLLHVSGVTGGAGAPTDATYFTLSTNGTLSDERVLTFNSPHFSSTDGGAGSTYTVALANSGVEVRNLAPLLPNSLIGNTLAGSGVQRVAISTGVGMNSGLLSLSNSSLVRQIGLNIGNGVDVPATGSFARTRIPWNATITKYSMGITPTGSATVNVYKSTHALFPPNVSGKITGDNPMVVVSHVTNEDLTLSGWTPGLSAGDWLTLNLDQASTCTHVAVVLEMLIT